uniref:SID1 transmembrane family member 1 n=1 Tax=Photinus pyralis TaxID=7054 RepID=A0A1Y1KN72_PHOPY
MHLSNCVIFILLQLTSSLQPPSITNADYNLTYNNQQINNSRQHVFVFPTYKAQTTSRVLINCEKCTLDNPLMVVAQQHKEILSWQLPLVVASDSGDTRFMNSSRTLCPSLISRFYSFGTGEDYEGPIVSVSTASHDNISYTLQVDLADSYIEPGVSYDTVITPSQARYYFYSFPENRTEANYETVILEIESQDDVCMMVSVQNSSCPVHDSLHDIKFEGYWETVSRKGGITISKRNFPHGFFVVFVAMGDNSDCDGITEIPKDSRAKRLNFVIKPSISYHDYVNAVGITVGCIALAYFVLVTAFCLWSAKDTRPRRMSFVDEEDCQTVGTPGSIQAPEFNDTISLDETEYDTVTEAGIDREVILGKSVLYLSDLARKDPRILKKKSNFYLWHVLTVAVFYGLPVVQLVVTYQKVCY